MSLHDGTTYAVSMPSQSAPVSEHLNWLRRCLIDAKQSGRDLRLDSQELVVTAAYIEGLEKRVRALESATRTPTPSPLPANVVVLSQRAPGLRVISTQPEPPTGGSAA